MRIHPDFLNQPGGDFSSFLETRKAPNDFGAFFIKFIYG